jgi:multiple sugar transport system permease protein
VAFVISRRRIKKFVLNILTAFVLLVCAFPFVWIITVSLKTRVDAVDPSVWIFKPTLAHYKSLFIERNILHYIKNSLIVVFSTISISMFLGTVTAYGFSRFNFKGKQGLGFWILSLKMMPPMVVAVSFFLMGSFLRLLDKKSFLIISYLLWNIPLTVWMMRGFIDEIPIEMEQAAWVDGCSRFKALLYVVFPNILPGLVATAIFTTIGTWNEFTLAFFLTSLHSRTLPTTITFFKTVLGILWGEMASLSVIACTPILIFSFICQKYLIHGLTFGSVKE